MLRSFLNRSCSSFITSRGLLQRRLNALTALYLHTSFFKLRSIENKVNNLKDAKNCSVAAIVHVARLKERTIDGDI